MSTSKIDHKELQKRLKEDELSVYMSEFMHNAKVFLDRYGRPLGMGIAIVAVAFIAAMLWRQKVEADYTAAQLHFGNAVAFINEDNHEQALQELGVLLNDYSGSELAPSAHLMRGNSYFELGQFDQARREYEKVLPLLTGANKLAAQIALAQTLRSLGQPQEAMAVLDEIASAGELTGDMTDQLRYMRGGCYEDMDQPDKALETYREIEPGSGWYSLVRERIEWLEAEPAAAAEPLASAAPEAAPGSEPAAEETGAGADIEQPVPLPELPSVDDSQEASSAAEAQPEQQPGPATGGPESETADGAPQTGAEAQGGDAETGADNAAPAETPEQAEPAGGDAESETGGDEAQATPEAESAPEPQATPAAQDGGEKNPAPAETPEPPADSDDGAGGN